MRSSIPFLIVFATACQSESSDNRAAPVQSTVASSASVAQHHRREAVDAGVDALCKTLLAEEKLDESALEDFGAERRSLRKGELEGRNPSNDNEDRSRPGPRVRCMSTGTFAWAIRLDKADAGASIRQTLMFAGPDNARA